MYDWEKLYNEGKIINGLDGFHGSYRCLSNFYPMDIKLSIKINDNIYFSSKYPEILYQALKCKNKEDIYKFEGLTCGQAKRLGRKIKIREDWEEVKDSIMEEILNEKLNAYKEFKKALKNIPKDMYIVEMNDWNDKYWGVCNKTFQGQNKLGFLLMKLRDKLQKN